MLTTSGLISHLEGIISQLKQLPSPTQVGEVNVCQDQGYSDPVLISNLRLEVDLIPFDEHPSGNTVVAIGVNITTQN